MRGHDHLSIPLGPNQGKQSLRIALKNGQRIGIKNNVGRAFEGGYNEFTGPLTHPISGTKQHGSNTPFFEPVFELGHLRKACHHDCLQRHRVDHQCRRRTDQCHRPGSGPQCRPRRKTRRAR